MMRVLDLNAVISDAESMLRRTLGNDIRMTAIFALSLEPVRADARKLQQVILSLVAHARQGMPAGGRFTIETKNVRLEQNQHPHAPPGSYVLLALSHTGVGMNDAALQRVFDPVVEPEMRAYSHGLELSKLPGILQQFGGHIQAESDPDAGAAFKIYLPRCDNLNPSADIARDSLAIPPGHETILLVEDDDSVRSLIRILLQSHGYKVLEAVSGDEAIHVAETYSGRIDLLITDVVLPRMNGKLVVNRVLALRPALKVLLISGYSPDRLAQLDCSHSDCAFLQKPFRCDVLGNLVRQLLDAPEKRARIA